MSDQVRRYLSELIGTLILVFVGGLSILAANVLETDAKLLIVAFGFGMALLIGLYAVGEISGGHFNPAVSFAALLDGRLTLSDMIGYWVAQVAGGLIGGLLLLWASSQAGVAATATTVGAGTGIGAAFLLEVALTAFFVMVILKVTTSDAFGANALTAIPLALVAIHLAGVPFSGASVNPARTLGSGVVGDALSDLWLYIVGPLVGAAVGWALYQLTSTGTISVAASDD